MANDEPTIVEATATASGRGQESADEIERAMTAAIQAAYDEGITDPDEIRRRSLAAREAVKNKT
jgi:hypothetical protein